MMSVVGAKVYCRKRVPAGALTLTPTGGADAEDRQGLRGDREVGGAARRLVGAAQRLQARWPGTSRWSTAANRRRSEVVLPGQTAAALGGQRDHLRQQLLHRRVVGRTGAVQAVGLAEGAQHLELDALARVVLPHQLRPGNSTRCAAGEQGALVHHCRLAASVAISAGRRDAVSWWEAAMSCIVTVTDSSSLRRVPCSLLLRRQGAGVGGHVGLVLGGGQRTGPVQPRQL